MEWALARVDDLVNWGRKVSLCSLWTPDDGFAGFSVASHLRPGLLRRGDDAHRRPQIRHGQVRGERGVPHGTMICLQVRHCVPSFPQTGGRDHRGRDPDQQDGPRLQEGLRPDARAQVGGQHGQLR